MKHLHRNFIFYLILTGMITLYFSRCTKDKITPGCIQQKIDGYRRQPVTNPPAEVWKYSYRGTTVYFFPNESQVMVDGCSELVDAECNYLCAPTGCFSGNGDGRCPDFLNERTNGILIWRDNR